jgi:excisionase family DNA binding protein
VSELLNVAEAAKLLHVTEATIRSWILAKKIAYVKLGRRVFLRREDCEELVEQSVIAPLSQLMSRRS